MRTRPLVTSAAVSLIMFASACGGGSPGSPAATTPAPAGGTTTATTMPTVTTSADGGVDPNAPEVVDPGDIPDDQVFVTFAAADGSYSVHVPEGWARTELNGVVSFTDKYNTVTIQSMPATVAPSIDSVTATGLADVSSDPTFVLRKVASVKRKAGDGVLATYDIGSAPNDVTGKKALLSVERYVFFHNATTVVLTLSGAKGADNVDPWKIVSDSLMWN